MAGVTTWNKSETPGGTEPWNYAAQVKRAIDNAGLVFEVATQAERDALPSVAPGGVVPVSTTVFRADLNQLETWNGTRWVTRPHVEFTYSSGGVPNGSMYGPTVLTKEAADSTDVDLALSPGSDIVTIAKAGIYSVSYAGNFGNVSTGTSWMQIRNITDTLTYASGAGSEFWCSASIPNLRITADNTNLLFRVKWTSGGTTSQAGRIRITRVG